MKALNTFFALSLALLFPGAVPAMDEADPASVGLSPLALKHLDKAMAALVETGRRSGVVGRRQTQAGDP